MDKFDDLLKEKAKKEADDFLMPQSFNDKIENLLENIDEKQDKNKWYSQRKILAIVACFAFMFLVGVKSIDRPKTDLMARDGAMPQVARNEVENYSLNNDTQDYMSSDYNMASMYENSLIDIDKIQNITMKVLDEKSTYKFINEKDDIERVILFINSLEKKEIEKQDLQEWDILMQTAGAMNHSILFAGNILNIDDSWYEINNESLKELINIYDELKYEEKDIKYCNF